MLTEEGVLNPRGRMRAPVEAESQGAMCATCAGALPRGASRCPHCGARTRYWWLTGPGAWLTGPGAWLTVAGALVGGLLVAVGWRRVTRRLRSRGG